jgi:hypothetical protein
MGPEEEIGLAAHRLAQAAAEGLGELEALQARLARVEDAPAPGGIEFTAVKPWATYSAARVAESSGSR